MPKVTGPLFSLEARKDLGKILTFQGRPSGTAVYPYKKPKVPLTAAQVLQRSKIKRCVELWQGLSDAEKAEWEDKAQGQGQSGYSYFIKQTVWLPIDVGSGAADYASWVGLGMTNIDLTNPVNLSGLITSVDLWFNTNATGVRVGIFYLVSGSTYTCRSSVKIGSVTAGSKKSFPVSLPVQKGDFIGAYWVGGRLEAASSGGSGRRYVSGEYIDPGDSANFTFEANTKLALYGQGIGRE